jgi:hypothetical protein
VADTVVVAGGADIPVKTITHVDGNIQIFAAVADTATLSNVADSATSVSLLAANGDRLGCIVQNDSTETLYLKYGATASTTSFTAKIPPGAYWEMPSPTYTGAIDGIWAANASGSARITELT